MSRTCVYPQKEACILGVFGCELDNRCENHPVRNPVGEQKGEGKRGRLEVRGIPHFCPGIIRRKEV